MTHILYIDDNIQEVVYLKRKLNMNNIVIHWLPSIHFARELINAKVYAFDLVIVDIMGTTFRQEAFEKEVASLNSKHIIITSCAMAPISNTYKFILKDDLIEGIKSELST